MSGDSADDSKTEVESDGTALPRRPESVQKSVSSTEQISEPMPVPEASLLKTSTQYSKPVPYTANSTGFGGSTEGVPRESGISSVETSSGTARELESPRNKGEVLGGTFGMVSNSGTGSDEKKETQPGIVDPKEPVFVSSMMTEERAIEGFENAPKPDLGTLQKDDSRGVDIEEIGHGLEELGGGFKGCASSENRLKPVSGTPKVLVSSVQPASEVERNILRKKGMDRDKLQKIVGDVLAGKQIHYEDFAKGYGISRSTVRMIVNYMSHKNWIKKEGARWVLAA